MDVILPEITGVIDGFSVLDVQPGDVLVVHLIMERIMDASTMAAMKRSLEDALGCVVVFVSGVERFEVLRPATEAVGTIED